MILFNLIPRLSLLLLPSSLDHRRKTLVVDDHVITCDTNFSTGVESTYSFCRSQLKRNKVDRRSHPHTGKSRGANTPLTDSPVLS